MFTLDTCKIGLHLLKQQVKVNIRSAAIKQPVDMQVFSISSVTFTSFSACGSPGKLHLAPTPFMFLSKCVFSRLSSIISAKILSIVPLELHHTHTHIFPSLCSLSLLRSLCHPLPGSHFMTNTASFVLPSLM